MNKRGSWKLLPFRGAEGQHFAAVLHAINGMDKDLLLVAQDDKFGRFLQDQALDKRQRASWGEKGR